MGPSKTSAGSVPGESRQRGLGLADCPAHLFDGQLTSCRLDRRPRFRGGASSETTIGYSSRRKSVTEYNEFATFGGPISLAAMALAPPTSAPSLAGVVRRRFDRRPSLMLPALGLPDSQMIRKIPAPGLPARIHKCAHELFGLLRCFDAKGAHHTAYLYQATRSELPFSLHVSCPRKVLASLFLLLGGTRALPMLGLGHTLHCSET